MRVDLVEIRRIGARAGVDAAEAVAPLVNAGGPDSGVVEAASDELDLAMNEVAAAMTAARMGDDAIEALQYAAREAFKWRLGQLVLTGPPGTPAPGYA